MRSLRVAVLAALLAACSDATPVVSRPAPIASVTGPIPADASAAPTPSAIASAPAPEVAPPPDPSPPLTLGTGGKVHGAHGLVTSVDANATKAAVAVLERGGNAIDAAVTAAYVLAVTHPSAGNLGGGGFMLVRLANGESYAIDFREAAPAAVTTEKVLREVEAGGYGWASTAVPGTVAGLDLARERFGTLPLADLVAPAIDLAKKGHVVSARAALSLRSQWDKLKADPSARAIFGKKGGKGPLEEGDRIVQRELAQTLADIAQHGDAGFYGGRVADLIEQSMKKNGGDVTKADLAAYAAKVRRPLSIKYRGFTIETMPPPSMGGIAVLETLRGLEQTRAFEAPVDSPRALHAFVESTKRAYADRRLVGADPDFYGAEVPAGTVDRLLSWGHVAGWKPPFDPEHATPTAQLAPDAAAAWAKKESPETTHFSVVDGYGNAVSCTVTLSASFGAKVVVPATGVVLSNAIGAFSPTGSNAPAPGKRMASSMSPTIASRDGKVALVVGSPGGDTIPNTVSQVLRNLIDYGMPVDAAVSRGRIHHQLLPDEIRTERGREPPDATKVALGKLGHTLAPSPIPIGDAKIILVAPSSREAYGVSDAREGGLALAAKAPKKAEPKPAK